MGVHDEVKFQVGRSALADAVAFARAGLGSGKSLAEQLFRFDIGDGQATVTASDGDLIAAADFMVTSEADGVVSFAVIGKKVVALLDKTRDAESYGIQVDTENAEFVIRRKGKAGVVNFERLDFGLLSFAVTATGKARQVQGPAELEIPRGVLVEALEIGSSSTTKNSGKVEVDHVELRQGRFLASDGRRITSIKSGAFHHGAKLKVPVPILGRLTTAIKTLAKDRAVIPNEGDGHFFAVAPTRFLAIRKVETDFPAVEAMFDADRAKQSVIQRAEFQQALGEVGLGLPSGKTEILLEMDSSGLTISAENSVGRRSKRQIEISGYPEGATIPIGIDHLNATLGSMKGNEVNLFVLKGTEAALIQDANDTRDVCAILPFRRKSETAAEEAAESEATGALVAPVTETIETPDGDIEL